MNDVLSIYRNEDKFIISKIQISNLKSKLDVILKKDDYIKDNSYVVRSLYFDSLNNIDFNTKLAGTKDRKKIRIRVYDPDDSKCKVEMKNKDGDLSHKISLWITKDDAMGLINGQYNVLTKYFTKTEAAIKIYKTMSLGCYKPVVMVEYDRIAYTFPLYDTRITFDYNIRSSESNFDLFAKKIIYTPLLNETILEVKYNGKLVGFISEILKPYKLTRISVSKYCIGRNIFYDFNY